MRLEGFKDPSAMHIAGPDHFQERWDAALSAAVAWTYEEAKQQLAPCADARP